MQIQDSEDKQSIYYYIFQNRNTKSKESKYNMSPGKVQQRTYWMSKGGKEFHAKGIMILQLLGWKVWQMKGNWKGIDGKRGKREINETIELKN